MDLLSNKYVQMLIVGAVAIAAAITLVIALTDPEPDPDIWCSFKGVNGQGPVFMGRVQGPVDAIRVRGLMSEPRNGNDYDVNGTAVIEYNRQRRAATVIGDFTVDGAGRVTRLYLKLGGEEIGNSALTIATLNSAGARASDRSRAYLYRDARFRLSHPLFYACRVEEEALERAAQ